MVKKKVYPPCRLNPKTEKPYKLHKWALGEGLKMKNGIYYYRVHCERCSLNDPQPPTH